MFELLLLEFFFLRPASALLVFMVVGWVDQPIILSLWQFIKCLNINYVLSVVGQSSFCEQNEGNFFVYKQILWCSRVTFIQRLSKLDGGKIYQQHFRSLIKVKWCHKRTYLEYLYVYCSVLSKHKAIIRIITNAFNQLFCILHPPTTFKTLQSYLEWFWCVIMFLVN